MRLSLLAFAGILSFFSSPVLALRSVPGQQCASVCGNSSSTAPSDIVCNTADFSNTAAGQRFQKCIACELNSTAIDPATGVSDVQWALYNVRYAFSNCLFGYPNATASTVGTPCITDPACGLFKAGVEYDYLSPSTAPYGYCGGFVASAEPQCSSCLAQVGPVRNFFLTLVAGCQQMPAAGQLLAFSGSIFGPTAITVLTPGATASASATPNSGASLSTGASVGIAIGAIVLVLIVLGVTVICCGKRRRVARLAERQRQIENYSSFGGGLGGIVPVTQPLNTRWAPATRGEIPQDVSPSSAGGYESDKHFTPYTSQYNSPVSARDMLNPNVAWEWKHPSSSMNAMGSSSISVRGEDGSVAGMSPGLAPSVGMHGKLEAFEMEKLRDQRIEARRAKELQIRNQFLRDAEDRGFTTANV